MSTQTDSHYKLLHRTKFTTSLPPHTKRYHKQHPTLMPSVAYTHTHTHVTLLRSKAHATKQLDMKLTAVQYTTTKQITIQYTQNKSICHNRRTHFYVGGQMAVIVLRDALLAVGKAVAKHEKSTYSSLVRCLHILIMNPGQRVFHI
jgi:hypothetical protein